jgi:hypothetical protein
MKQIFKLTNRTAIYHGNGKYTVIADEGFALRGKNGMLCKEITTTDYNQFEVVEDKDNKAAQEAAKVKELEILNNKKAFGTLSTIFEMACDLNKLHDDDERLEALDKKLREDYPSCDFEETFPPIAAAVAALREVGLEPIADAFDKAWADEDFQPIIDAMPELTDNVDEGEGEGEGEGDGEGETETPAEDGKPTDDTETPAEDEKPADETEAPAEEPEKPADEQPAEDQPKTKKAKAAKAE